MTYIDLKKTYTGMHHNLHEYSQEDKDYWNNTKPIEVLNSIFKCSIEIYAWDKKQYDNVWDDDIPIGDVHFITHDNKIYNSEFEQVSTKDFKGKYGVLKKDINNLINNKQDHIEIPVYTDEDTGYAWIKFNDLSCYTIRECEDLKL